MRGGRALAAGAAVGVLLAGCAGAGGDGAGGDAAEELVVFAAASLRGVFEELEPAFEKAHPGVDVTFSFAGSSDLVAQVEAGAPADVLATADERTMRQAQDAGLLAGEPTVFATNHLTLVTPPGNPAGITGLDASLAGADLVVCAPQVPCGSATAELAARAGVTLAPVSEETAVTSVLGKVSGGEADAGLVYVSDAVAAGERVSVVPVPGAEAVVNRYPAAVVSGGADLAAAWVELLTGPEAAGALERAGFGPAEEP